MKIYKNDKLLTEKNLSKISYDRTEGCLRNFYGKKLRSTSISGTPIVSIEGKMISQNRIVCKLNNVEITPTCTVEHIDGDRNNIRIDNLKVITLSEKRTANQPIISTQSNLYKNDKYLPRLVGLYRYNPDSGLVTNIKTGHVIKNCKNGYPTILHTNEKGGKHSITCHRFALFYMGYDIKGKEVDHLNGVRDDNRLVNLRITDRSTNRRNAARSRNNTTGITGVCWHKHNKKWEVKGLHRTIGFHRDFFEACCIRKSWENEVGGFTDRHGVVDSMY